MRFGRRKPAAETIALDVSEKNGIRSLHLGEDDIQSSMRVKDPIELVLAYSRCMMAFLLWQEHTRHVLLIGLGGGSIAKWIHHRLPDTRQTCVEIHPEVIAMARSMFCLPLDDDRLSVIAADGVRVLAEQKNHSLDVIMMDAYSATGIAPALATEAFFADCRDRLASNGILTVNLWGSDKRFAEYVERIRLAFDNRILCLPARQRGNVVVLGFASQPEKMDWVSLLHRGKDLEARYGLEFTEMVTDLARMNPHTPTQLGFE